MIPAQYKKRRAQDALSCQPNEKFVNSTWLHLNYCLPYVFYTLLYFSSRPFPNVP